MVKKLGAILFLSAFFANIYGSPTPPPLPKPRDQDVHKMSDPHREMFQIETRQDESGTTHMTATTKKPFRTNEAYLVSGDSVLVDNKVYKPGDTIHQGATIPEGTTFKFSQKPSAEK